MKPKTLTELFGPQKGSEKRAWYVKLSPDAKAKADKMRDDLTEKTGRNISQSELTEKAIEYLYDEFYSESEDPL